MNTQFFGIIAVIVTGFVTVFFCQTLGFAGLMVPPLAIGCIMLIGRPRFLLGVFWFATLFSSYGELMMNPTTVKGIEQILGLLVLGVLLGEVAITRQWLPHTGVLNGLLFAMLWLIGTSWFVNKVPNTPFVFYLMTYLKHIWVFYFVLRHFGTDVRPIWIGGLLSFLSQVVFNGLCYLGVNRLPHYTGRTFVDISMGTVGDASYVAYYMAAWIFVLLAVQRRAQTAGAWFLGAFLASLAIVQVYLTYTMHIYILLAGGVFLQFIAFRGGLALRSLAILAVSGIVLLWALTLAPLSPETRALTSFEGLRSHWQRMTMGTKAIAYSEVLTNRSGYLAYPWIGGGPGNYTSQIAFLMGSPLSKLPHLYDLYVSTDRRFISGRSSVLATPRTGVIALWGELGPPGFLLYWGMYAYAAMHVWRQLRRGAYLQPRRAVLAEAFIPTMAVFLMLNLLRDAASVMPLNVGLWIWCAAIWLPDAPDAPPPAAASEAPIESMPFATPLLPSGHRPRI